MKDEGQYQQLILQYTQLKSSAQEISKLIDMEDYDAAITMIKNREPIFISCKCMRNYLELTDLQEKELNQLLDDLRKLEQENMQKIQNNLEEVKAELSKSKQNEKIHNAYKQSDKNIQNTINYEE